MLQDILCVGSFQPSNDLKLRFYALYKQATKGPCNISRPAFWDVINKAKWDAWHSLGDMSSEEAMQAYVNAIKEVNEQQLYNLQIIDC
jgi:acyl-CoA-binding protein